MQRAAHSFAWLLSCAILDLQAQSSERDDTDVNRDAIMNADTSSRQHDLEATRHVESTQRVIEEMKRDPELTELLALARGVFVVPNRNVGDDANERRGGEGILVVNRQGEWIGPAFFNFDTLNPVANDTGQAVALLLMSASAVSRFTVQETEFTLDGAAGLTLVAYAPEVRAHLDEVDVIVWSNGEALAPGASPRVTEIARDADENMAYYGQAATPQEIFSGVVASDRAEALRASLPRQAATR